MVPVPLSPQRVAEDGNQPTAKEKIQRLERGTYRLLYTFAFAKFNSFQSMM
jgi:hypothetical protein